jgi:glucose-6-phosphate isomerase
MREDSTAKKDAESRRLKFLANVDPIDFYRAMDDLDIEETLVVINSKTFTTAETMLNAATVKNYIIEHYKKTHPDVSNTQDFVQPHFCAVSTSSPDKRLWSLR